MARSIMLIILSLMLVACGQPGAQRPDPPAIVTPAANAVPMATPVPAAPERLVVLSHDSFSLSQEVLDAFQAETGIVVEFLKAGDTGTALNQAILSRDAPVADVFFGVDNTFMGRALAADLFIPFEAPALTQIPDELRLDPENRLLPVDVGYVLINYDKAALAAAGLTPPTRLEELTEPQWRGQLVVQNPATSSPGLAFLLATIAHFGETGTYTWRDFWRDLRANEVYISPDWSDAYYNQFSGGSGQGSFPLVVSYSTSPAAEVFFSDGALPEPPTGNLIVPGGVFRQIEFVGILRGTQREAAARQFVDFMLQPTFQADIPLQMFVYPANPAAALPEVFEQFAEVPPQPAGLSPDQIDAGREAWITEWTELVLR
ncbi:MAG: thiamine ABC transporter substrate-binding protein [Oscillochloridaceae bacterium umkhey_bin13]